MVEIWLYAVSLTHVEILWVLKLSSAVGQYWRCVGTYHLDFKPSNTHIVLQTTHRHFPEHYNMNLHCLESFKSYITICTPLNILCLMFLCLYVSGWLIAHSVVTLNTFWMYVVLDGYICSVRRCVYIYIYTYVFMYVRKHACMYVCVCVVWMCVCMYGCMYVYICVCVFMCMNVCMYVFI